MKGPNLKPYLKPIHNPKRNAKPNPKAQPNLCLPDVGPHSEGISQHISYAHLCCLLNPFNVMKRVWDLIRTLIALFLTLTQTQ